MPKITPKQQLQIERDEGYNLTTKEYYEGCELPKEERDIVSVMPDYGLITDNIICSPKEDDLIIQSERFGTLDFSKINEEFRESIMAFFEELEKMYNIDIITGEGTGFEYYLLEFYDQNGNQHEIVFCRFEEIVGSEIYLLIEEVFRNNLLKSHYNDSEKSYKVCSEIIKKYLLSSYNLTVDNIINEEERETIIEKNKRYMIVLKIIEKINNGEEISEEESREIICYPNKRIQLENGKGFNVVKWYARSKFFPVNNPKKLDSSYDFTTMLQLRDQWKNELSIQNIGYLSDDFVKNNEDLIIEVIERDGTDDFAKILSHDESRLWYQIITSLKLTEYFFHKKFKDKGPNARDGIYYEKNLHIINNFVKNNNPTEDKKEILKVFRESASFINRMEWNVRILNNILENNPSEFIEEIKLFYINTHGNPTGAEIIKKLLIAGHDDIAIQIIQDGK